MSELPALVAGQDTSCRANDCRRASDSTKGHLKGLQLPLLSGLACQSGAACCSSPRANHKRDVRKAIEIHNRRVATSGRRRRDHASAAEYITDISYYSDRPGHGAEINPFNKFLDFHLPRPSVQTTGNKAFCVLRSSAQDRVWSQYVFDCKKPSGRQDCVELRDWVNAQLATIVRDTVPSKSRSSLQRYAEKTLDVYNTAVRELARQVSLGCVERGRLMADLWASQSEILTQVLMEQRVQKDAHEAVAAALQKKAVAVDEACQLLQQKLTAQAQHIAHVEAQLAEALRMAKQEENVLLGHGSG